MKKIILLFSGLLFFLLFDLNVNASNLDTMSFANRTQSNFPFTTFYDATDYVGQYYLFSGSDNLPSYAIYTTCATGPLTFSIQNQQGNLSYMGYVDLGGSCTVNGYTGSIYVYYFNLISYTDAGNGNMGINYSMFIGPDVPWTVHVTFTSVSFSNASDFTSALQNQTLIQNQNKLNNSQMQTNQELGNLNNNLNDSDTSGATGEASEFFSGFQTDTFGLTSIITAPLNLIGNITSSSCSEVGLPLPYVNKTLKLPCLSSIYQRYFGSFLTIYQTITFGIVAYWVCVRVFALVKDFKNPDHDEIEVLDL